MKKHSALTVFVVIAVHVALCWCVRMLVPPTLLVEAFWPFVCLGELATPLLLLLFQRSVPIVTRAGMVLVVGGVADRQNTYSQYLVYSLFFALFVGFGLIARLFTGWNLDNEDSIATRSRFKPRTFSIRQLLATTAVVAVVTAVARPWLEDFVNLNSDWHGWYFFVALSLATFLILCSVFSQWRVAYGLCLVVAIIVISTIGVLRDYEDRGWLFAVLFMIVAGNATLPAITLRLCGWRWVRLQREAVILESPARCDIS